jgi:hypothetical protein
MVIDALRRELMSPEFVREFIAALALLPGAEITANTDSLKLERRRPQRLIDQTE